jgi:hypothetical protein
MFPLEWFFKFWKQGKVWVGSCQIVGSYVCCPQFFITVLTGLVICSHALSCKMSFSTCEHVKPYLAAKYYIETSCRSSCYSGLLRHSICCYHCIHGVSHIPRQLAFELLATAFFWQRRVVMRGLRSQFLLKILNSHIVYGNNPVLKLILPCLKVLKPFFYDSPAICFLSSFR